MTKCGRAKLTRNVLICVARIPGLNSRRTRPLGLTLLLLLLSPAANAQLVSTHAVSSGEFFIAFCCVVMVGIATNSFLVGLLRPGTDRAKWQEKWEFSPATEGGFSWRNLALWSLLSLFMELLMIRWIS